jgi:hypothetical protein
MLHAVTAIIVQTPVPQPSPVASPPVYVPFIQMGATVVAAIAAAFALWFNAMPWCDMATVEVDKNDNTVKLRSRVRNAGRGQAFEVYIWLLEYGGIQNLEHSKGYIGALSPSTELEPRYESGAISLAANVPSDNRFRVLLTWKALFWTCGEAYVEEHYGEPASRPRVKLVYPWTRVWRAITRYDIRGRK